MNAACLLGVIAPGCLLLVHASWPGPRQPLRKLWCHTQAQDVTHLPWALVGTAAVSTIMYTMLAVALQYVASPNAAKPALPPVNNPTETVLTFTSAFVYLQGGCC